MNLIKTTTAIAAILAVTAAASSAQAAPVTFTKLTGLTGAPGGAQTAVFRADLSSVGFASISAFSISDSGIIGGSAPGEFSGFDLDAVIISATNCATAACVAGLTSDVAISYASGIFTPGTQLAPNDPKLYGTNGAGTGVDNAVATLGSFDGFASTLTPGGFMSLGINGILAFNLLAPLNLSTPLYLYFGEVGDNGEAALGSIQAYIDPVPDVPLPAALPLFAAGLAALGWRRKKRAA